MTIGENRNKYDISHYFPHGKSYSWSLGPGVLVNPHSARRIDGAQIDQLVGLLKADDVNARAARGPSWTVNDGGATVLNFRASQNLDRSLLLSFVHEIHVACTFSSRVFRSEESLFGFGPCNG